MQEYLLPTSYFPFALFIKYLGGGVGVGIGV